MRPRRSWWGWGDPDAALDEAAVDALAARLGALAGRPPPLRRDPVDVAGLSLPAPRLRPPAALAGLCSDGVEDRAAHAQGKSFRDVVRALEGRIEHPPDLVVRPRDEADLAAVLEWSADVDAAVVPYGGGSSVCGGVEPDCPGFDAAVSVDLRGMSGVVEVDAVSLATRVRAGTLGPDLEAQLRPHGLTLRHFPQSFEFSTVGGWLATRSGGHFATLHTHIDDAVESIRALTPRGVWESRRLPASGAGPSPDRLLLGSEGVLGIITEAWLRVLRRPEHRAGASLQFDSMEAATAAVRALAQSGLHPANCRLLDATEALISGAGDGSHALLILGFESADHPVGAPLHLALELCADHGAVSAEPSRTSAAEGGTATGHDDAAQTWRSAFLRAPYIRDAIARLGWITETAETAITWDRFDGFHAAVLQAVRAALHDVCGGGIVASRLTHVYPDGCAPYYTVIAPSRPGAQVEQWDAIKRAASDAILDAGGTITHHHAVGRDHRPWYDRQRPDLFAVALRAAKSAVDPDGILNPGVLVGDAPRRSSSAGDRHEEASDSGQ